MIFLVVFLVAWLGIYGPLQRRNAFLTLVTMAAALVVAYGVAFSVYR